MTLSLAAAPSLSHRSVAALQPNLPISTPFPPPACVQSRNQCVIISTLSFRCQRRSRRGIAMTRSPQQGSVIYSNGSLSLRLSRFLQIGEETHFQSGRFVSEVLGVVFALRRRHRHLLAQAKEKKQTKAAT